MTGDHPETNNIPPIPGKGEYSEEARLARLDYLRQMTGKDLPILGNIAGFKTEQTARRIENLVGSIEIPVGIAGPLLVMGEHESGPVFAPMATVEGTLVAATNRGAGALMESGGVTARVLDQHVDRAPMFIFGDLLSALKFVDWVRENEERIREVAESQTRYGRLKGLSPRVVSRIVHLSMYYDSGDASGQNLSTKCTAAAVQWIVRQLEDLPGIDFIDSHVEGGMNSDKKVTLHSFMNGRGTRVIAECVLKKEIVADVLKTTPRDFYYCYNRSVTAALQSGMIGYTINCSNVIAAMFAATGQDIASTHESGCAHFFSELLETGDLYVSVLLPSLMVGTIGGGTVMPGQRELLEMLDCYGENRSRRFAEIIAAFCLALEVSTGAAITANHFAAAHRRFG